MVKWMNYVLVTILSSKNALVREYERGGTKHRQEGIVNEGSKVAPILHCIDQLKLLNYN